MREQKYEVEFLNNENGRVLLFISGTEPFIELEENNEGLWEQYFTKQEIKTIDERYLKFAVPVEENND